MLSFRKSGTSNIGEDFYLTSIDQVDAVARAEFAKIKAALKQIESAAVHGRDRAGATELVLQGLGQR